MVSIPPSSSGASTAVKTPAIVGNQPRLYRGGEVMDTAPSFYDESPLYRRLRSMYGDLQDAGVRE